MERLAFFVSTLRWQDVIDIALNSYVIFRLYVLFRGTTVLRVLIGIIFLWFFQRVAVSVGLIVTSWVMQGVTAVAALIIIVVFRNEIRSVLQAKNWKSILWGFPRWANTPVEVIVDSVFEMAGTRTGGLIVFPGQEDLTEVAHGGLKWNGLISRDMILSIFWGGNPVHDGAAIVQGNRVTEVSALLPLSQRADLPSMYGTRHRAALGLAESTDALVIVVSEERGAVSVAKSSQIGVVETRKELAELLAEHLGGSRESERHRGMQKLEFGAAALASFLFAGIIWFGFARGLDTLITVEVPLEYMNRKPSMKIMDTSVNSVRLGLSGSAMLLKSLRPEQIGVRLDLSDAQVGTNRFTLTPGQITLPPGIVLKDVKPAAIEVSMDIEAQKEVPVQADWMGRLPENLVLTAATILPDRLGIVGDSTVLAAVTTIYTEKIVLDRIKESGSVTVRPVLNPPSLRIAPGSKEKVVVEFTVQQRK